MLRVQLIRGSLGLGFKTAKVPDDTFRAVGFSRFAGVPAVQDQPMVCVMPVFLRDGFEKFELHLERRFSFCQAGAIGYAENMGVNGYGGFAESCVEHDVRRFPAHSRKTFE